MLDVGVIGVGPQWELRYRPALLALRQRIRVRAILSPVTAMAEAAAAEFRADVATGLVALAERPGLRALLAFETSWYGQIPMQVACDRRKPLFLGLAANPDLFPRLTLEGEAASLIVPELPLRYTPATQRLHELLATRLGRVRRIEIKVGICDREKAPRASLIEILDWCRSLVGDCTARVLSASLSGVERCVQLAFCRASGGEAVPIEIHSGAVEDVAAMEATVTCDRGTVRVGGPRRVAWSYEGETVEETLDSDRGELEVMLDHFSRRVVGGLVPVPMLEDLDSASKLATLVERSFPPSTSTSRSA